MEGVKVTSRNPETLVRYWAVPGMEGFTQRNGGLEKDYNTGAISTDGANHQKMVDTRQAKIDYISNVIPEISVEGNDTADTLVISWGSTHGHLMTAVKNLNENGQKVALAHFNYIHPLPKNTKTIIEKYKKVLVCELNRGNLPPTCVRKYRANTYSSTKFRVSLLQWPNWKKQF